MRKGRRLYPWITATIVLTIGPPVGAQDSGASSPLDWVKKSMEAAGKLNESSEQTEDGLSEAEGQQQPEDKAPAPAKQQGQPPAHGEPSGEVLITDRGAIEMHFSEMSLPQVLRMLAMESRRNITVSPAVTGTVTTSMFDVDFDMALKSILRANNAGYIVDGDFIYIYTNEELATITLEPPESRLFRLNYINATDAQSLIAPLLSEVGAVSISPPTELGIGSSADAAGGDNTAGMDYILVFDRPRVLKEIEKALAQVDVRPKQVLIEATILRATLNNDNALGIDFTIVGGVDLELLGATSNGIEDLMLGQLPTDRFEQFNSNATTNLTRNFSDSGLTFGVIKDHVAIFLHALEEVTDTSVIANPKVLVLNKQKGQVIVGRRDGYLTTTFTDTVATQTIEFLETGTSLHFRPMIAEDGSVRVELHPEDSTGGVDGRGLPFETTTEITTNVTVQDGQTILIGGLFRELATDTRSQVPGVAEIPGIGALFKARQDSLQREEVIILLTVHIVKDDNQFANRSREVYEDMERTRVGQRLGMMWFGRDRLAQEHYQNALEAFALGDTDKALWEVNLSLHSSPRHLDANGLREKILSHREWEDEGAIARYFMYQMLIKEEGLEWPPHGRPAPPFIGPDELRGPSGLDDAGQSDPATQQGR